MVIVLGLISSIITLAEQVLVWWLSASCIFPVVELSHVINAKSYHFIALFQIICDAEMGTGDTSTQNVIEGVLKRPAVKYIS